MSDIPEQIKAEYEAYLAEAESSYTKGVKAPGSKSKESSEISENWQKLPELRSQDKKNNM